MPRVTQVTAAKDHPRFGIKKGQKHYRWKIKTGPVSGIEYRSLEYPKPSQLTHSAFLGTLGDIEQGFDSIEHNDGAPEALREIAQQIRDLGDEAQESLNNMPDSLQQGPTGEMLQERVDGCSQWADEIDTAADSLETKIGEINDKGVTDLEEFENLDPEAEDYEEPSEDEIEEARQVEISNACDEAIGEASSANPGMG